MESAYLLMAIRHDFRGRLWLQCVLPMMTLQTLCQWIYDWPASTQLRESDNAFPLIETAHVLAVALIAGSIITVDLRLIGAVLRDQPVERIAGALLPWTWRGFALMVVTGLPLFASEAVKLYANPAFRVKLLLLALAGVNAFLFHRTAYRGVGAWSTGPAPFPARAFAGVSLLLWAGVIVSGRLIAVFHGH
jgi:hypothetical protein